MQCNVNCIKTIKTHFNQKENVSVEEDIVLLTEELAKLNGKKRGNLKQQFKNVGIMIGGAQTAYKKLSQKNLFAKETDDSKQGHTLLVKADDPKSPPNEENKENPKILH